MGDNNTAEFRRWFAQAARKKRRTFSLQEGGRTIKLPGGRKSLSQFGSKVGGECGSLGERVERQVSALVRRIVEEIRPERIILFGSLARGDFHETSDIDLIVVGDFRERFFDRVGRILELNDTDFDLEAWAYTRSEFQRMVGERRPFIVQALKEGKVVYGSSL